MNRVIITRLVGGLTGSALLALAHSSGCIDPGAFTCIADDQCVLAPQGRCHANGACSYPNEQCPSEREWSRNAGALAGTCVDPEGASGGSSDPGDSSADPGSGSAGMESGVNPACGDGTLDPGEQCDDGNLADGDGCNADCLPSGRVLWSDEVAAHGFDNTLHAVQLTSDGQILAAGYTSTEPADDQYDSNQYDFLFSRHSPTGEALALVSEAHAGRDELRCVLVDPDGEIWVGGERSTMTGAELWLGRVTEDDAFATGIAYGQIEPRQTVAHDCVSTATGELVAVGMLDGGEGEGYESWDRLIVYDPLGDGWTQHLPADVPLRDIAFAVESLADGDLLVAGSTSRTLEEASDRWITRLRADGSEVWSFVDSGPGGGQEEVFAAAVRGSTVFAAGATVINQGNVEREWLGALDLDSGALQQEDDLMLPSPSTVRSLALDPAGDVVLCGRTGEGADTHGFVARFDPEARQVRWIQRELGIARAEDVAVDEDGTILVVGSTIARGDNGPAYVARLAP